MRCIKRHGRHILSVLERTEFLLQLFNVQLQLGKTPLHIRLMILEASRILLRQPIAPVKRHKGPIMRSKEANVQIATNSTERFCRPIGETAHFGKHEQMWDPTWLGEPVLVALIYRVPVAVGAHFNLTDFVLEHAHNALGCRREFAMGSVENIAVVDKPLHVL